MTSREQFEESFSSLYGTPKRVLISLRNGDTYRVTDGDRVDVAWVMWQLSRTTYDSLAMQNMKDIAHCLSDLRRFIEMKWPTIADLPSQEAVLLNGPENKHEVNAMIAALNRVADFYESEQVVCLPEPFKMAKSSSNLLYYYADEVDQRLTAAGLTVKSD